MIMLGRYYSNKTSFDDERMEGIFLFLKESFKNDDYILINPARGNSAKCNKVVILEDVNGISNISLTVSDITASKIYANSLMEYHDLIKKGYNYIGEGVIFNNCLSTELKKRKVLCAIKNNFECKIYINNCSIEQDFINSEIV